MEKDSDGRREVQQGLLERQCQEGRSVLKAEIPDMKTAQACTLGPFQLPWGCGEGNGRHFNILRVPGAQKSEQKKALAELEWLMALFFWSHRLLGPVSRTSSWKDTQTPGRPVTRHGLPPGLEGDGLPWQWATVLTAEGTVTLLGPRLSILLP